MKHYFSMYLCYLHYLHVVSSLSWSGLCYSLVNEHERISPRMHADKVKSLVAQQNCPKVVGAALNPKQVC